MSTRRKTTLLICIFILLTSMLSGCAALMPQRRSFPGFIAVIASKNDTFSSLASKYLNDPSKGWVIADYNNLDVLKPGQQLIIPLTTEVTGGLTPRGYQTVPILAYHNFSDNRSDKMTVKKADFEAQMKLLKDLGYHVISLDEFFDFIDYKINIPRKSCVITIDDGWQGVYDIAYPILKKYRYPATLFVYTDLISGSKKTLSWDQVGEMMKNGIDMQNHTKTHRDLGNKEKEESFETYFRNLKEELEVSEDTIRKRLGKKVRYLAYPYGNTNPLVIALLRKRGYRGAFTVDRGSSPFFVSPYRINRSVIYGDMSLKKFEKNLTVYSRRALR
ncbi:MAG: polysaccharide deacetylase family protein [Deltaproteobacteria bacterium]|nr:polysaccharide deacetylase family protein [Deltaproteobacteria bacterium]MBN2688572.1 polysaccharide deacetylase family protein [Deltaproteobacteria bacterium]